MEGKKRYTVLLVTNSLYPYLNANSEIAYRIAHYLHESCSCSVMVLGFDYSGHYKPTNRPDGFTEIPLKSVTTLCAIRRRNANKFLRRLSILAHPCCYRYLLNQRKYSEEACLQIEFTHTLRKLLRKKKIDCIIGFSNPTPIPKALSSLDTPVPYIEYKLDPWSSHYWFSSREDGLRNERRVDEKAAAIITTRLVKNGYPQDTDAEILKKIRVLEFPNILERRDAVDPGITFEEGKTHCIFGGTLYKDIRNPKFTVDLFARLKDDGIVLHLFSAQRACLPKKLPDNVVFHGVVESDVMQRLMSDADILVNIGNTISNQMPSKILTYISLGKPILNMVKIPDCPTLPYLERYPLALNIPETPEPTEEAVEQARRFILGSRGNRIPFETIKEIYHTCTPEYVGDRVYDIICSAVEGGSREPHSKRY